MKVTFDTNAWQPVVRPDLFPKDPRHAEFLHINAALRNQQCEGCICETVCTLEAVRKADRKTYLGGQKGKFKIQELESDEGIGLRISFGPDHSQHPGLHPILADRVREAVSLGMRFLHAPRIGTPSPPELVDSNGNSKPDVYAPVDPTKRAAELTKFGDLCREIEARGVGLAVAKAIAERIERRTGLAAEPWFRHFLEPAADHAEERAIQKAVAEWADADSICAHVASGNDLFCSEDQGKSAAKSILDAANRSWLSEAHGVQFVTLQQLAARL